jgi:hypothetical protein
VGALRNIRGREQASEIGTVECQSALEVELTRRKSARNHTGGRDRAADPKNMVVPFVERLSRAAVYL